MRSERYCTNLYCVSAGSRNRDNDEGHVDDDDDDDDGHGSRGGALGICAEAALFVYSCWAYAHIMVRGGSALKIAYSIKYRDSTVVDNCVLRVPEFRACPQFAFVLTACMFDLFLFFF